jgi:hypothetical protein
MSFPLQIAEYLHVEVNSLYMCVFVLIAMFVIIIYILYFYRMQPKLKPPITSTKVCCQPADQDLLQFFFKIVDRDGARKCFG